MRDKSQGQPVDSGAPHPMVEVALIATRACVAPDDGEVPGKLRDDDSPLGTVIYDFSGSGWRL